MSCLIFGYFVAGEVVKRKDFSRVWKKVVFTIKKKLCVRLQCLSKLSKISGLCNDMSLFDC